VPISWPKQFHKSNKMENSNFSQSKTRKYFRFEKIATLTGFVVDCFTIISIIFALKLNEEINIYLPKFVTPELAFGIWVVATYTYFGFLHTHWERNRSDNNYYETFGKFIVKDLFQQFRKPALLFPFVVLLVILAGIIANSETLKIVATVIGVLLFIGFSAFGMASLSEAENNPVVDKKQKIEIDKNWDYLKKRIKIELSGYQWINISRLSDVAELLEIDVSAISYAYAKYAYENPSKVKYGYVHSHEDTESVTGTNKVLVNIELLDNEKYYFVS
jgi:hypothetical protein